MGKGLYQVSYLRVHEGTLQACCPQASEFSFEAGLRHLLPSGRPRRVVWQVSEPRDPSAYGENLECSSKSLAGPPLSAACVSQPQSALEEFKPTLAHLKPQVCALHMHL